MVEIVCESEEEKNVYILGRPTVRHAKYASQVMGILAKGEKEKGIKMAMELSTLAKANDMTVEEYIKSLSPDEQAEFAGDVGVTLTVVNELIFPALCATLRKINDFDLTDRRIYSQNDIEDMVEAIDYGDAFSMVNQAIELVANSLNSARKKKELSQKRKEQLEGEKEPDTQQ